MEQVLIAGNVEDNLNNGATEYNTLSPQGTWDATEDNRLQLIASPGTIRNMRVGLSAAPGGVKTWTFTLRLNKADTLLAVTITGAALGGSNIVNNIAVVAGDRVDISCVPVGAPAASVALVTVEWVGSVAGESLCLSHCGPDNGVSRYSSIQSGNRTNDIEDATVQQVMPIAGTFKKLYVRLMTDHGAAGAGWDFVLRKNGVDTALSCTILSPALTGSDVVNTVAVAQGDLVNFILRRNGVPAASVHCAIGVVFVSAIDGECIYLGGAIDTNPSTAADNWATLQPGSQFQTWAATEAWRSGLGQAPVTLKKLYCLISAAPGAGNSWTFSVRVATAASGIICTINDPDTTGSDMVNSKAVADFNYLGFMSHPVSGPVAASVLWGVVGYILPAVGAAAFPKGPAVAMLSSN